MPNPLPLVEATSQLNFGLLVTQVAMKLGCPSYGSSGTGIPQAPTDTRNLNICQGIVNDAIRMVIADAPAPAGWFWGKPVAQVDLWPIIGPDYTGSTYVSSTGYNSTNSTIRLALTAPRYPSTAPSSQPVTSVPNFVQSMEQRTIWLGGQPTATTPGWFVAPNSPLSSTSTVGVPFTILDFAGPQTIDIYVGSTSTLPGSLSTWNNKIPFSFAQPGDYTLPANFAGEIAGDITFIAQTNRGMLMSWTDEALIRQRRQNYNIESGTPYWAAVRIMPQPTYQNVTMPYNDVALPPWRRRWELMTWRVSQEFLSLLFPYVLAFDSLVNPTDLPPSPISFDDTLLAACRAQAERYMTDSLAGPDWAYYRSFALPNALKINGRAANRSLGYCGSGKMTVPGSVKDFRAQWYQRPPVSVIGANIY
jgi:hypothetical protein